MGSWPQTNFSLSNFLETKGTRVRSPARLPACLRARTVRRASRGGGQRGAAPAVVPRTPCACSESSFREHTAQLPSWNPPSDPHSSPTERLGNQQTGASKLYVGVMCWSFLRRDPWIVLTGRTWWRN